MSRHVFASILFGAAVLRGAAAEVDFAQQIRPILSDKCFACHGPDRTKLRGGLTLTVREEATREREGRRPIAPGKAAASELVRRIFATDSDEVMPPPETLNPLTRAEKELLKRWIQEGAPYAGHWAFEPIRKPAEPAVKDTGRKRTSIDAFVLAPLERQGFGFAPDAPKEKLIRRVAFDLTGLPPTREETRAFVADASPRAFEKMVDGYLSRESYGERMASEWMDVARYSDTYGYQVDRDRFVWPYRDWVIKAFNANQPYDAFVTEQLAGDLLPGATDQQVLATAFNRLHPQKVEGGSTPEEFRVEYVSDRIQTFATAFLGLTMECCKCHEHKYDPIAQDEYYSLASFFDNIDEAGLYSFFTPSVPTPTLLLADAAKKREIAAAEKEIVRREQALAEALRHAGKLPKPAQPTVAGLVGYYDFEDAGAFPNTVNPTHSKAGMARNTTLPGRVGQGVKLTGDDEIVLGLGNFTRNDPFTISLWLKSPTKFDRAVVFHRSRAWTDAASRGYELLIEDGRLSAALIHFYPGNALRVQAADALPLNRWVHVTMAYDGSSRAAGLKLFVDGREAAVEIVRDKLTKNITGGGGDNITIGARFRDRGFKGGAVDEFKVFDRRLVDAEIRELAAPGHLASLSAEQLQPLLAATESAAVRQAARELKAARDARSRIVDPVQEIMVMREMAAERPTYFLYRGAYDQRRQPTPSGTPKFLHPYPKDAPKNRLGLARWLTDPANPLTARVTVNRYWQMLFGRGLVKTANDFGSQGAMPTHPELVNWLAADFIAHGWDVKRLLKQMVMSTVYRQDSAGAPALVSADPDNLLLGRAPRYRLAAEMLRDNALYLSGLLAPKIGGASVKPYEVAEAFKPTTPDKGEGLYRRSLYTYWKRTAPAPVMMALDAARRDVCTVSRETTATPLQAFVFMNDPQFVEAARKLAERALAEAKDDPSRAAAWLFEALTGRRPAEPETRVLRRLYEEQLAIFSRSPAQAEQFLKTGAAPPAKINAAKLAALNVVASALLSHDECVMKR